MDEGNVTGHFYRTTLW